MYIPVAHCLLSVCQMFIFSQTHVYVNVSKLGDAITAHPVPWGALLTGIEYLEKTKAKKDFTFFY